MTPQARIEAAIGLLDRIADGEPAEKALTGWARGARYAGSGDRAAVRDHVFSALRCWQSSARRGGAETGRGRMIGLLRMEGTDPAALFTGEGHAPEPLSEAEAADPGPAIPPLADCPDWLVPELQGALGTDFPSVMDSLRQRAPVFVRVNLRNGTVAAARKALAEDGIEAVEGPLSPTALELVGRARQLRNSRAYRDGLVELQDAASQFVTDQLPLDGARTVLDYCAGGGGKVLAIAGRSDAQLFAHDIDPARMSDLPARAERAGVAIRQIATKVLAKAGPFDLVLADAPCSGSGAWRRAPEGKWRLTPERLGQLHDMQDRVLAGAAALVAPGGVLGYATCSLLPSENSTRVALFMDANPGWSLTAEHSLTPLDGGDGFYLAVMRRA